MRFSLSIVSAAMLATLATAAPAAQTNYNIELSSDEAPTEPIALELGAEFETFNWAADKSVDRTFTLYLDAPAQLQITDFKLGGDAFEVLDNGEVIGETSEGDGDEDMFAETPEEALEDDRFSHATFVLDAGEHEISLNALESANIEGTGAIRIVPHLNAFHKSYKKRGGDWDDDEWDDDDDDKWDDDDDDKWDDDDDDKWDDDDDDKWDDDDDDKWDDDDDDKWDDDDDDKWDDDDDDKWDDDDDDKWNYDDDEWDDDKDDDKWSGKGDKWSGKDDKWSGKNDKWDKDDKWEKDWDKKKIVYVYYTEPEIKEPPATTTDDGGVENNILFTSTVTSGTTTSTETVTPEEVVTEDATSYYLVSMPWLTI